MFMKKVFILIGVSLIAFSCDLLFDGNRDDYESGLPAFRPGQTNFTDEEIKNAVYSDYKFPENFYTEDLQGGSPYYENTVSIKPLDERTLEWRELCTDSREQAREWSELSSQNSAYYRDLVRDSETEKYFQFRRVWSEHPTDIILSRVHKCRYLDRSEVDRFKKGRMLGVFNRRPISVETVSELIEYLWFIENYNIWGFKVLSSFTVTEGVYIRHILYTTKASYGDWGVCDHIKLVREEYDVHILTGYITFREETIRSIGGICR
jgi:hypothetical protein